MKVKFRIHRISETVSESAKYDYVVSLALDTVNKVSMEGEGKDGSKKVISNEVTSTIYFGMGIMSKDYEAMSEFTHITLDMSKFETLQEEKSYIDKDGVSKKGINRFIVPKRAEI